MPQRPLLESYSEVPPQVFANTDVPVELVRRLKVIDSLGFAALQHGKSWQIVGFHAGDDREVIIPAVTLGQCIPVAPDVGNLAA